MKKILTIMALLVAFVTTGFADTWTVAGSAAALNGTTSWAEANAANDMTSTDGVNFTLTVTDCTLEQGTNYEFKVVKNHAWGEAYPGENYTFGVSETAVYTVVYSFNADTKAVGVETTKTGEAGQITHTYTVAGNSTTLFGESTWDPSVTANDMTLSGGLYTWTKNDVELAANLEIEFKVCVDHAWGTSYPSSNYVVGSGDGYDGAGTYDVTITFNEETKAINATFEKQVENAEITSVQIFGTLDNWNTNYNFGAVESANTPNVYTSTIPLWLNLEDYVFELKVNPNPDDSNDPNTKLVHFSDIAIDPATPEGWLVEGSNDMIVLKNSISGYAIYNLTATWTPGPDASKGWTLKVEGVTPRQTVTATFVNGANWEGDLYAYAWKKNSSNEDVAVTAAWPGNKMTKNSEKETINGVEYDVWTFTLPLGSNNEPQFIIFSDGTTTNKTADLVFENGKKYTETVPGNAEIESVIVTVPYAPIDPINITNKKQEVDGKYVYSIDMDLSVVLDDIPFNFTINGETLPVSADMLDPSENNLLETISIPISSYLLKNVGSGYAVYTATATWTPNPDATSQWKLLVVGKDQRPEATTYSILYNTTGAENDWKVGDTMTESDGEFTATIKNKPGMLFAIAPTGSVGVMGIQWGQIIRPVTDGNNWEIDFADYNGTTELNANGKVWAIDEANNADVIINFTPGETGTFTITNELEFTIGQYGYSTYSNSRKYKVVDAAANFVTVSGSEATLVPQEEGAVLPAMTGAGKRSGIIISGTAGAKAIIKSANQSDDAVDSSANLLAGSGDNSYNIGTQFAEGDEYTAYIFTKPDGKDLGFYKLDPSQGATLAAHKAFLAVPMTGGAPQFIGFGGTTGIDATLNDNGQMINDNVIYDLSGRRVMNPTKGLYIINGKKVVIK